MRYVITGPTGAIGMAIMKECVKNQDKVLAICHKGSQRMSQIPKSEYIEVMELDMTEYKNYVDQIDRVNTQEMNEKNEEYDIFIHLAWNGTTGASRNDADMQQQNIANTLDAVRLAKAFGCHTFIGAGSQAEYGRSDKPLRADTPAFPENGYGMAKLCAGQLTRLLCDSLGMRHIWLRILSIYGPYDGKGSMIMSTISKLKNGEKPSFTKGEQMWDYLYSEDAAKAILLLAEKGVHGKIYPIGSGQARPLKEYIELLRDAVNPKLELGIGDVPYAEKQVMYLCADIEELKKDTGFEPQTTFEKGIRYTAQSIY